MMWHFHFVLLACLLGYASAQDEDCDFFQSVTPGQTYYLYSQRYPNNSPPSRTCRWQTTAPTGYRTRLVCSADIMQTPGCVKDFLLISRTGDPTLSGGDTFCGFGSTTIESTAQKIAVGFITNANSTGSRFSCELTAFKDTTACQCGYKYGASTPGTGETGRNEYPMMAGLFDLPTANMACGGVIISSRCVLTAAHCIYQRNPNRTAVVVGDHNIRTDDTSQFIQMMLVSDFMTHPLFTTSTSDYDIGLVLTEADIAFSEGVGPVCLPVGMNSNFEESAVTALGWGLTSDVLNKVELNVVGQNTCSKSWSTLTRRQICTNTRVNQTCQDYSGGPLLWTEPNSGTLYSVGIATQSTLCATTTSGLNTRTTEFLNWIQTETPYAIYCKP